MTKIERWADTKAVTSITYPAPKPENFQAGSVVSLEPMCICGNPLRKPKRGPMPAYCSPKCRVRAHRSRR